MMDIKYLLPIALSFALSGMSIPVPGVSSTVTEPIGFIPEYSHIGSADDTLVVPDGVEYIGEGAFAASSFQRVELPESLDSIGPYAFAGCTHLTEIRLPESLRHIGDNAFGGCTELMSATFPKSLKSIGDRAFHSTSLSSADLSHCKGLNRIGDWAFAFCPDMSFLTLPDCGLILGEGAFMGCHSLESVEGSLPEAIPAYLFAGCSEASLDQAFNLSDIRSIGGYALSGNNATDTIVLKSSLDSIGNNAMERMYALKCIDASRLSKIPATGTNVWDDVDQPEVELLTSPEMAHEFASAPQWQEFHIGNTTGIQIAMADAGRQNVEVAMTENLLTIRCLSGEIASVDIFSINGTLLTALSPGQQECSCNLSDLARGAYIARITVSDQTERSFTFIK